MSYVTRRDRRIAESFGCDTVSQLFPDRAKKNEISVVHTRKPNEWSNSENWTALVQKMNK